MRQLMTACAMSSLALAVRAAENEGGGNGASPGVPQDQGQGASAPAVAAAAEPKTMTASAATTSKAAPRAGSGAGKSRATDDAESEVKPLDGKRPVVWLQSGHPVHRMADLIMVSEAHAEKLNRVGRARIARLNDVTGLKPDDIPYYEEP